MRVSPETMEPKVTLNTSAIASRVSRSGSRLPVSYMVMEDADWSIARARSSWVMLRLFRIVLIRRPICSRLPTKNTSVLFVVGFYNITKREIKQKEITKCVFTRFVIFFDQISHFVLTRHFCCVKINTIREDRR